MNTEPLERLVRSRAPKMVLIRFEMIEITGKWSFLTTKFVKNFQNALEHYHMTEFYPYPVKFKLPFKP